MPITEIKREDEVVVLNPAGEVICCGRAPNRQERKCGEEKRGHAVNRAGAENQSLRKTILQGRAGKMP